MDLGQDSLRRAVRFDLSNLSNNTLYTYPSYLRPSISIPTSKSMNEIIQDDVPSLVRHVSGETPSLDPLYTTTYTPSLDHLYNTTNTPCYNYVPDDPTYRLRPNTEHVVNRQYNRHKPVWSWTDFTTRHDFSKGHFTSLATSSDRFSRSLDYSPLSRHPLEYTPLSQSSLEYSPLYSRPSEHKLYKPRTSYFPGGEISSGLKEKSSFRPQPSRLTGEKYKVSADIFSRHNSAFPFRKYRSDFVPYAPYPTLYDSARYSLNPAWISLGPTGHKYRKARYVYVPEEENSSKSLEMERIMRETRLRDLCRGVYTGGHSEQVTGKPVVGKDNKAQEFSLGLTSKSFEAESAPLQGEGKRRKNLTAAEKRRRNETLAIGISREELLTQKKQTEAEYEDPPQDTEKVTSSSKQKTALAGDEYSAHILATPLRSSFSEELNSKQKKIISSPDEPASYPKEPTPPPEEPRPPPKEPTPPPKEPTPPPKEPTPTPKEATPPPKEPTPTLKEPTPPPKEPTPNPKEPTPPPKEPTPTPKEPTAPPKESTPTPKEQTPPQKEPTQTPKEPTPPPKELTPPPKENAPPPKETTPPPKEQIPPPEEPAPQSKESISPPSEHILPPKEPTPSPKGPTPPPKEPTAPPKDPTPPPKEQVNEPTPPPEETVLKETEAPHKEPTPPPKGPTPSPEEEETSSSQSSAEHSTSLTQQPDECVLLEKEENCSEETCTPQNELTQPSNQPPPPGDETPHSTVPKIELTPSPEEPTPPPRDTTPQKESASSPGEPQEPSSENKLNGEETTSSGKESIDHQTKVLQQGEEAQDLPLIEQTEQQDEASKQSTGGITDSDLDEVTQTTNNEKEVKIIGQEYPNSSPAESDTNYITTVELCSEDKDSKQSINVHVERTAVFEVSNGIVNGDYEMDDEAVSGKNVTKLEVVYTSSLETINTETNNNMVEEEERNE